MSESDSKHKDYQVKKNNLISIHLAVFALISIALVLIWFRGGHSLGGGEVGNPFYNIQRMFEITKMAWSDWGLGTSIGFSVGGAPYYKFFAFFQDVGIPGFVLQASFFFFCLFLTLASSYLLVGEVLPKTSKVSRFLSAIFYLVNPYALVNIWNRFLPNQIMFYSFLPLGIWLFIYGLRTKKYFFAVLNMVLTAILSVAFIGPAQTLMFWGLIFLIVVYYFIFVKKDKFVVFYFLINVCLWFAFNFFWVIQQLSFRFSQSYSVVSSSFFTSIGNFETFNSLSRELGKLSNLFLLQHGPFFIESFGFPYDWPLFYNHLFLLLLQWVFVIYVLIVAIKKIKSTWVNFFFLIFLVGIFTSKGNTQPLGEVLDFLFKNVSFLEFFRNPLEKSGILLSLGMTPLVALAISALDDFTRSLRKQVRFVLLSIPWIYLCVFLGFPFWTGLVFTNGYAPSNDLRVGYQVVVPDYYSEADRYLSNVAGISRFISLPLGGEGIFNTWPKGYVGVEQSAVLFSIPSLSYDTTIPFYSNLVSNLEELFIRYPDFYRLAGMLNLKYLVFRPDFDYLRSGMRDPKVIDSLLSDRVSDPESKVSFAAEFLPLKIFKFNDEVTLPKIYPAARNINSDKVGSLEDALLVQNEPRDVISNYNNQYLEDVTFANVSHSLAVFNLGDQYPLYSEEYYTFPYVSILPGSYKYNLVRLKEKLQLWTKFSNVDKTSFQILLLGKRLREAKLSLDKNDIKNANLALNNYSSDLPHTLDQINLTIGFKQPDERTWREKEMFTTFSSHLFMLNEFEKSSLNEDGYVTRIKSEALEQVAAVKILPRYSPIGAVNFSASNRIVYQWRTDREGDYEIILPGTSLFPKKFLVPSVAKVQLDDRVKEAHFQVIDGGMSLGTQKLTKGLHELQIVPPSSNNLLDQDLNFVLDTLEVEQREFVIPNFDPYTQYDLSFDYKAFYGAGLDLAVSSNLDYPDPRTGLPRYSYSRGLPPDGYWYDYKHFSTIFNPLPRADDAKVIFSAPVWNNCHEAYKGLLKKCQNEEIRKKFDRPTRIEVKNVSLTPRVPPRIVLISKLGVPEMISTPEITFAKLDYTNYRVEVKSAESPFLLVFSELYDPGWSIYLGDEEISNDRHFLVNGYANSWWIDKTGDFDLNIVYKPQKLLDFGYRVSFVSASLGALFLLIIATSHFRRIKK